MCTSSGGTELVIFPEARVSVQKSSWRVLQESLLGMTSDLGLVCTSQCRSRLDL